MRPQKRAIKIMKTQFTIVWVMLCKSSSFESSPCKQELQSQILLFQFHRPYENVTPSSNKKCWIVLHMGKFILPLNLLHVFFNWLMILFSILFFSCAGSCVKTSLHITVTTGKLERPSRLPFSDPLD